MFFITLKDKGKRGINPQEGHELSQQEFMRYLRAQVLQVKDLEVFMQDLSLSGFSPSRGFPVEFSIRGREWEKLSEFAQTIEKKLTDTGIVTDVDSDYVEGKPEVRIYPNRVKASEHGVSVRAIAQTVNAMIGGVIAGKYPFGGHRNDVRVRYA